jgi:hypothetical protein
MTVDVLPLVSLENGTLQPMAAVLRVATKLFKERLMTSLGGGTSIAWSIRSMLE